MKAIVYVVDGAVARVRAVDPDIEWSEDDDRGYADLGKALSKPLTDLEITRKLPALGIHSARRRTPPRQRQTPRTDSAVTRGTSDHRADLRQLTSGYATSARFSASPGPEHTRPDWSQTVFE